MPFFSVLMGCNYKTFAEILPVLPLVDHRLIFFDSTPAPSWHAVRSEFVRVRLVVHDWASAIRFTSSWCPFALLQNSQPLMATLTLEKTALHSLAWSVLILSLVQMTCHSFLQDIAAAEYSCVWHCIISGRTVHMVHRVLTEWTPD